MNSYLSLDPKHLLQMVASSVPDSQRDKIVVIGSIATAWAFRDVMEAAAVQTKDIDIVLHPAASAPVTAVLLGDDWLRFMQRRHVCALKEFANRDFVSPQE